jgi:hypothetical protein
MLILFAIGLAPSGCSSTGSIGGRGDELQLSEKTNDGKAMLYRVDDENVLHFAGGRDAQMDRITWSDPLTPDEQETLWRLVRDYGWMEKPPPEGDGSADVTYRISVRMDGKRRTYRVKGACKEVAPVADLLEKASLRRFGHVLDALPEPSLRNVEITDEGSGSGIGNAETPE